MPTVDPHRAARRLATLDLHAHLADPARKQAFVTPMFDTIAPRYDAFTRRFSLGMDRRWKAAAVQALAATMPPGARLADVACGTGDLAQLAVDEAHAASAIGLDASPQMLVAARARHRARPALHFAVALLEALPLPDQSVEGCTAGYAFRNAPRLAPALAECARVLAPGSPLVVLDFYRPASRWWSRLFTTYLRLAGNLVGWWWHRTPVVYGYLGPSVAGWITAAEMTSALQHAGFRVQHTRTWLAGGVALHVAVR